MAGRRHPRLLLRTEEPLGTRARRRLLGHPLGIPGGRGGPSRRRLPRRAPAGLGQGGQRKREEGGQQAESQRATHSQTLSAIECTARATLRLI